jgi:PPOX class probable F420-dependent enzyme
VLRRRDRSSSRTTGSISSVQSTRDVEVRRRVGQARVARLATVDGQGRPHVVPICFALADDVLYSAVDSKPKRSPQLKRLENIRANPNVTVLVDHYEDDWSRLWWVRVRGRGRVLEGGEERDRALALLADKYPQYRAEPPVDAVIAIDLDEWREWPGGESTEETP